MFEECFVCTIVYILHRRRELRRECGTRPPKTIRRLKFSTTRNVSILSPNPTKQFFVDTQKAEGKHTFDTKLRNIIYIYICVVRIGFEFLSRRYNFMKNTFHRVPLFCCWVTREFTSLSSLCPKTDTGVGSCVPRGAARR